MSKMSMTAPCFVVKPPIIFKQFDDFSNFHYKTADFCLVGNWTFNTFYTDVKSTTKEVKNQQKLTTLSETYRFLPPMCPHQWKCQR